MLMRFFIADENLHDFAHLLAALADEYRAPVSISAPASGLRFRPFTDFFTCAFSGSTAAHRLINNREALFKTPFPASLHAIRPAQR